MPKETQNIQADPKEPIEQIVESDEKKTKGFMESLRLFLQRKKPDTSPEKSAVNEHQEKKVKVGKKAALGLVMSRFAHLSRSGALKKTPTRIREPAATMQATKKVSFPAVHNNESVQGDIKERIEKRKKNAHEKKSKDGLGIFNETDMPDLEENMFDETDSLTIPTQSISLEGTQEVDTSSPLPEEYYVDIPESLLKDMEELSSVAQTISSEEIEQAASFLGVFEGGIDIEDFAKYSSDPVEQQPKKGKKKTKQKESEDSQDSKEAKDDVDTSSKETSVFPSEVEEQDVPEDNNDSEEVKKDNKKESKESGFSMKQFKAFFEQQKKLMAKLTAVANTPLFEPKKMKQLMDALPALSQANKIIEAQKNGTLPTVVQENNSTGLEGVPSQVKGDTPTTVAQDGSGLVGVQGSIPGDGPVVQTSQVVGPVKTGLEGAPDIVAGDGLTEEELKNKELQPGGAIESIEETPAEAPKKRSFFGRKPKKESEAEIRGNMGIGLSGTVDKKDEKNQKKVNISALQSDMQSAGFLESTLPMTDDTSLASIEGNVKKKPELSAKEAKALERQQKENAKEQAAKMEITEKQKREQEKAWAEEAKRREKMLEEKRKEKEKIDKKMKSEGGKMTIQVPKKAKKKKGLAQFIEGLNYMGMSKERYSFIDNLGVMMDAGLPLMDAIRTQEMEAKNKSLKKLMGKMVVAIETGSPLWRAMESTYFFEEQQVAMVQVGEEAGNLVENLRYLSEQSEKQQELKSKVKTAMIYPIIVFTMLGLIVTGLGMFVLPNLISVIFSLGVPLPFVTRMIVQFTNLFANHGTVLVPSVLGGCFVLLMLHKYTGFKCVTQWFVLKVPGIGVLMSEAVLSQFGVTMGGLLSAGVPVTDALESLANVTTVARYKKFYYLLLQRIRLGDSFATAFTKIKLTDKCFPTSMQQLIRTGEKSGSLTKVMGKLAEIHDKRATQVAEKLPVILEPMLLLFIGSLVGTIALGVLAPIYSVVGNVGG